MVTKYHFSLLIILGYIKNSDNSLAPFYLENIFQNYSFKKNQFLQVYIYKYKFDNDFRFHQGIEIILKIIELLKFRILVFLQDFFSLKNPCVCKFLA